MEASFATLPPEILCNIFENDFSPADVARFQRVCKRFALHNVHRTLNFRLDAPSLSGWKLARRILFHGIGTHCTMLTVSWERRRTVRQEVIFVESWVWTNDEMDQIREICEKLGFVGGAQQNILMGVNSEALLPLILCFMPKLRSLDLGRLDQRLIGGSHSCESALTALGWSGSFEDLESPWITFFDHQKQFFPTEHIFWLMEYLAVEKERGDSVCDSIFGNIESFSFTIHGDFSIADTEICHIFPMTIYPRLRSLNITDKQEVAPTYLGFDPLKFPSLERLSIVVVLQKCASLQNYQNFEGFMRDTARLESLKYVYAAIKHEPKVLRRMTNKKCKCVDILRSEDIGRDFLRKNPALKPTDILIQGSGFNSAGVFIANAEKWRTEAEKERRWKLKAGVDAHRATLRTSDITDEITSHICDFLGRTEIFSFMLTCRAFYETCHRHLWSSIPVKNWQDLDRNQCILLKRAITFAGESALRHLECIKIEESTITKDPEVFTDMLRSLLDLTEAGYAPKLKYIQFSTEIISDRFNHMSRRALRFLRRLKAFSEKRKSGEFSSGLRLHFSKMRLVSQVTFDYNKLVNLEILTSPRNLYTHDQEFARILADIAQITSLLAALPRLKRLGLRLGLTIVYMQLPVSVEETNEISKQLEELQAAVTNLKDLESLCQSEILGHPSFLLIPPENCTTMGYRGPRTVKWWRNFAQYPFAGVKRMMLDCYDLSREEKELFASEARDEEYESVRDLKLESVKVSGLEWFGVCPDRIWGHGAAGRSIPTQRFPADLVRCILRANKGISDSCMRKLASDIVVSFEQREKAPNAAEVEAFGEGLPRAFSEAFDPRFREDIALRAMKEQKLGECDEENPDADHMSTHNPPGQ